MKKIVKKVLGFVSLLFVLPFLAPACVLVLAGLFIGQLLANLVSGDSATNNEAENQNSNKWDNASDSLSWNCLNI